MHNSESGLVDNIRSPSFSQELERHICERGYKNIYLQTATVLTEANNLYESAGYLQLNGSEIPQIMNDPRGDRVMRKILSAN